MPATSKTSWGLAHVPTTAGVSQDAKPQGSLLPVLIAGGMFGFFLAYDAGVNLAIGFAAGLIVVIVVLSLMFSAVFILGKTENNSAQDHEMEERQRLQIGVQDVPAVRIFQTGDGLDVVVHISTADLRELHIGGNS